MKFMPEKNKKVTCGACGKVFENDEKYLAHKCSKTGFTPTDVEHFDKLSGGRYSLVSKAALTRGAKRKELEKASK